MIVLILHFLKQEKDFKNDLYENKSENLHSQIFP